MKDFDSVLEEGRESLLFGLVKTGFNQFEPVSNQFRMVPNGLNEVWYKLHCIQISTMFGFTKEHDWSKRECTMR